MFGRSHKANCGDRFIIPESKLGPIYKAKTYEESLFEVDVFRVRPSKSSAVYKSVCAQLAAEVLPLVKEDEVFSVHLGYRASTQLSHGVFLVKAHAQALAKDLASSYLRSHNAPKGAFILTIISPTEVFAPNSSAEQLHDAVTLGDARSTEPSEFKKEQAELTKEATNDEQEGNVAHTQDTGPSTAAEGAAVAAGAADGAGAGAGAGGGGGGGDAPATADGAEERDSHSLSSLSSSRRLGRSGDGAAATAPEDVGMDRCLGFNFQSKYLAVSTFDDAFGDGSPRRPWCSCDVCAFDYNVYHASSSTPRGSGPEPLASRASLPDLDAVELETNENGELEEVVGFCSRPRLSAANLAKFRKGGVLVARHKLFVVTGDGIVLGKIRFGIGILAPGVTYAQIYARMNLAVDVRRCITATARARDDAAESALGATVALTGDPMSTSTPAWKAFIGHALRRRNRREADPFRTLLDVQTRLMEQLENYSDPATAGAHVADGPSRRDSKSKFGGSVAGVVKKLLVGGTVDESDEHGTLDDRRPGHFIIGAALRQALSRHKMSLNVVHYIAAEDLASIAYRACYALLPGTRPLPGARSSSAPSDTAQHGDQAHPAHGNSIHEGALPGETAAVNIIWVVGPIMNSFQRGHVALQVASKAHVNVFVVDQRGHGMSAGPRGDAPSLRTPLRDVRAMVRHVRMNYLSTPIVLVGHGLGGTVVLNYASWKRRLAVDGYAFFAPLVCWAMPENMRRVWIQHSDAWIRRRMLLSRLTNGRLGNAPAIDIRELQRTVFGKKNFDQVVKDNESRGSIFITEIAKRDDPPDALHMPESLSVHHLANMVSRPLKKVFVDIDKPFGLWYGNDHEIFDPKPVVAAAELSRVSNKNLELVDGVNYIALLDMAPELLVSWLHNTFPLNFAAVQSLAE